MPPSGYLVVIRPALSSASKNMVRADMLYPAKPFLGADRQIVLQRWLRGWEQCKKLGQADVVVVSFGNRLIRQ